jgi:hypothetical protein
MTMTRRQLLATGTAGIAATWLSPRALRAAPAPIAVAALDRSQLVYVSPIVSGGRDSRCQAEVWFVHHDGAVHVCTQSGAWRAEAVRRGFDRARLWIGEFGVWTRADGRYRSAPYLEAGASLVEDPAVHAAVLPLFGEKYAAEWDRWGPRFRDGLADGSRVLLRYDYAS